jgi:sulfoxide reductase heme-binding subunit YedZ
VHLISSPVDWYAARAAGVTAYVLLSAVVLLGLTTAGRRQFVRWPRFAIEDVHRVGGMLVGCFVVLHVATVALDAYLPFPLTSLLVPGLSSYRTLWVAFGIVAAELLLALAFTNRYRNRLLSYRFWRRAHYVNFAVWLAATLHGLGTGTDRGSAWLLSIYTLSAASVGGAIGLRFLRLRALGVATGLATAALVVGVATGPLHVSRTPRPRNSAAANFSGELDASINRVADSTLRYNAVMISGTGGGSQQVWFRADQLIDLRGGPVSSSFVMEYLPSGLRCQGRLTQVGNAGFQARCSTRAGLRRVIDVQWQPSESGELKHAVIVSHGTTSRVADSGRGAAAPSASSP